MNKKIAIYFKFLKKSEWKGHSNLSFLSFLLLALLPHFSDGLWNCGRHHHVLWHVREVRCRDRCAEEKRNQIPYRQPFYLSAKVIRSLIHLALFFIFTFVFLKRCSRVQQVRVRHFQADVHRPKGLHVRRLHRRRRVRGEDNQEPRTALRRDLLLHPLLRPPVQEDFRKLRDEEGEGRPRQALGRRQVSPCR